MSTISRTEGNAAAVQANETAQAQKKTKFNGKAVGSPELSEKASKYYEELKKKYSGMDFILVSKDKKEEVKANAAKYANNSKTVVLIDEEKIEKMAEDESYRKQYEGIIRNAASGLSQLQVSISKSPAKVKSYGIMVNDNGTASLFAVIDKSLAKQKERIEKKAEEKKATEKEEAKKAAKEKQQGSVGEDDTITVTANSADELLSKINDIYYATFSDKAWTEEEKQVGQSVDFRL